MKYLLILILAITSCTDPELPEPTQPEQYVTFQVIGLATDVYKHVTIQSGGFVLDTIVLGNLTHKVRVHQANMYSKLSVRSNQPVSDKLVIQGETDYIMWQSDCEWVQGEVRLLLQY